MRGNSRKRREARAKAAWRAGTMLWLIAEDMTALEPDEELADGLRKLAREVGVPSLHDALKAGR